METSDEESSPDILSGTLVARRFEVSERIGLGYTGVVYRALDRKLNNEVALKLLSSRFAQGDDAFRRLRREVSAARSLLHPNIVRTHSFGRVENGSFYISMELVRGISLREYVERAWSEGGSEKTPQISIATALSILRQVLSALTYAHEKGVIHQALKPANILLEEAGRIKITDFGTVRIADKETGIASAGQGQVIGTPDYMAPEQIRGQVADTLCDIYSLGVIAYELSSGRRPFAADSPVATAFKQLYEALPTLPDSVPEWYKDAVRKATAKARAERVATAAAFAELLPEDTSAISAVDCFSSINEISHTKAAPESPQRTSTLRRNARNAPVADRDEEVTSLKKLSASCQAQDAPTLRSRFLSRESKYREMKMPLQKKLIRSPLFYGGLSSVLLLCGMLLSTQIEQRLGGDARAELNQSNIKLPNPQRLLAALRSTENIKDKLKSQEPGVEAAQGAEVKPESIRGRLNAELSNLESSGAEDLILPGNNERDSNENALEVLSDKPSVESKRLAAVLKAQNEPGGVERSDSIGNSRTASPAEPFAPSATQAVQNSSPSSVLTLYQGPRVLGDESPTIEIERLGELSWKAEIVDIPDESKKEIQSKAGINIFDPEQAKVLLRLDAQEIGRPGGGISLKGSLGALAGEMLFAGPLRLDLVYDGEVLSSKEIRLSRSTGEPFAPQPEYHAGDKPILRVPTIVEGRDLIKGSDPAEGSKVQELTSSPSSKGGVDQLRTFTAKSSSVSPKGLETKEVLAEENTVSNMTQAGQTPVVRETLRGVLNFSNREGEERKALVLRLAVAGSSIQGSATIAGFEPFRAGGKISGQSLELELQNGRERFRLSGAKQGDYLRGRYHFSAADGSKQGNWVTKKVN